MAVDVAERTRPCCGQALRPRCERRLAAYFTRFVAFDSKRVLNYSDGRLNGLGAVARLLRVAAGVRFFSAPRRPF
jgi:hypothetical protein